MASGTRQPQVNTPIADFAPTCGVYALVDPQSRRVMYVGQSVDIDYRYRQHLNIDNHDGNKEKRNWIRGLREIGLVPKLIIIAECDWAQSDDVEKQYIKLYKSNGQCELNIAEGGKYSRAISKLRNTHRDDWFRVGLKLRHLDKLIWELVEDLGSLDGAKSVSSMIEVRHQLNVARSKLEKRLLTLHPDWEDIGSVFCSEDPF